MEEEIIQEICDEYKNNDASEQKEKEEEKLTVPYKYSECRTIFKNYYC